MSGLVVSLHTRTVHTAECPHGQWIRYAAVVKLSCVPVTHRRFLKPCGNCKPILRGARVKVVA